MRNLSAATIAAILLVPTMAYAAKPGGGGAGFRSAKRLGGGFPDELMVAS